LSTVVLKGFSEWQPIMRSAGLRSFRPAKAAPLSSVVHGGGRRRSGIVKDISGLAVRAAANLMTKDEPRRIVANIVNLSEPMRK
jgi:hypothetical protein